MAVRLKVHETSMFFVNSHLAAHMDEVEKRNSDYRHCCLRLAPGNKEISQHEWVSPAHTSVYSLERC